MTAYIYIIYQCGPWNRKHDSWQGSETMSKTEIRLSGRVTQFPMWTERSGRKLHTFLLVSGAGAFSDALENHCVRQREQNQDAKQTGGPEDG